MYEIEMTEVFDEWLKKLRITNRELHHRVSQRLYRMSFGNLGDVKSVGERVLEARIFSTPAIRLYFIVHKEQIIVLLSGGKKDTQDNDIKLAKKLASTFWKGIKNEIS